MAWMTWMRAVPTIPLLSTHQEVVAFLAARDRDAQRSDLYNSTMRLNNYKELSAKLFRVALARLLVGEVVSEGSFNIPSGGVSDEESVGEDASMESETTAASDISQGSSSTLSHLPVPQPGRSRRKCVVCPSKSNHRSRVQCGHCGVALCSPMHGPKC